MSVFGDGLELTWGINKTTQWSNKGLTGSGLPLNQPVIDNIEKLVDGEFELDGRTVLDLTKKVHFVVAMKRGGFLLKRFGGEKGLNPADDAKTLKNIENIRLIEQSDTIDPSKFLVNQIPFGKTNDSIISNEVSRNVIGASRRFTRSDSFFGDDEDDFSE